MTGKKSAIDWMKTWKTHRQEFIPWIFALLFYTLFMTESKHTKFTVGMLSMVFIIPPIVLIRMLITAFRSRTEQSENNKDIVN